MKILMALAILGSPAVFAQGEVTSIKPDRVVINGGDITEINIYSDIMTVFSKTVSCSIEKHIADLFGGTLQLAKAIKGDSTLALHCIGSIAPRLETQEPMAKARMLMMTYKRD